MFAVFCVEAACGWGRGDGRERRKEGQQEQRVRRNEKGKWIEAATRRTAGRKRENKKKGKRAKGKR